VLSTVNALLLKRKWDPLMWWPASDKPNSNRARLCLSIIERRSSASGSRSSLHIHDDVYTYARAPHKHTHRREELSYSLWLIRRMACICRMKKLAHQYFPHPKNLPRPFDREAGSELQFGVMRCCCYSRCLLTALFTYQLLKISCFIMRGKMLFIVCCNKISFIISHSITAICITYM